MLDQQPGHGATAHSASNLLLKAPRLRPRAALELSIPHCPRIRTAFFPPHCSVTQSHLIQPQGTLIFARRCTIRYAHSQRDSSNQVKKKGSFYVFLFFFFFGKRVLLFHLGSGSVAEAMSTKDRCIHYSSSLTKMKLRD